MLQGTEKTYPALPCARSTACQGQSHFPRWAVPKPGYTPLPLNHFSLLLLNNLSPYRQNGSTGSPTFLGLMYNLQSDARLPRIGRTERLGHLPKSKKGKHQLEQREKAAQWKSVSAKQRHLLNPQFPRWRQGGEVWASGCLHRGGEARERKYVLNSALKVCVKYYQCCTPPQ